jgi:hypothetical protein
MNWETVKVASITIIIVFLQAMGVFWLFTIDFNRASAAVFEISDLTPLAEIYEIPVPRLAPTTELPKMLLYRVPEKVNLNDHEFECLARNIFYEASIEPIEGMIAVAQITHNRVRSGQWGRTFCSVIYAPHQFSWTLDPTKRDRRPHGALWQRSQEAARQYLNGSRVTRLENSQHYHADYVSPRWGREEHRIKQIGAHIFYDLSQPVNVAQKQQ